MQKVILLSLLLTVASLSQTKQINLNSSYQVKVGDYAALLLPNLIRPHTDLDAPIVCTYELESNTIDLEIFGGRSNVEGARGTMNNYMAFVHSSFIPYANRRLGIYLTDQNFRLSYFDRLTHKIPKLILQYIGGQFVVPAQ
ncbi:MAG: hypothetical protein NTZ35_06335 [Ignavibacteriales bacterium]|nr:hypothetical protein [Ignavibacteriales bacterium]